jgi:hypothetical protein
MQRGASVSSEKFSEVPEGSDNTLSRRHLLKLAAAIPLCLGLPLTARLALAADPLNEDMVAQWAKAPTNGDNLGWLMIGQISGSSESPNGWQVDEGPLNGGAVVDEGAEGDQGRYLTVTRTNLEPISGPYTLYYNSGVFDRDHNGWAFLKVAFSVTSGHVIIEGP